MTLDELLRKDAQGFTPPLQETHLSATIAAARASFIQAEAETPLPFHIFLRAQLQLIQKRWWLAQSALLLALALALPSLSAFTLCRSLAVAAALFVILLVPECAKNRTYDCLEIECTTYYSLRHIYAARLLLFGLVDIVLITSFCCAAAWVYALPFFTLLTQFLLPLTVTAGFCFAILANRRGNGPFAIVVCLLTSGVWWLLLLNDHLYQSITVPIWLTLFIVSLAFLMFVTHRWMTASTKQWEGSLHGTLYD